MRTTLATGLFCFVLFGCGYVCPFGIGDKCQSSEEDTKAMQAAQKKPTSPQKIKLTAPKVIVAINETVQLSVANGKPPYKLSIRGTGAVSEAGVFQSNKLGKNEIRATDANGDFDEVTIEVR